MVLGCIQAGHHEQLIPNHDSKASLSAGISGQRYTISTTGKPGPSRRIIYVWYVATHVLNTLNNSIPKMSTVIKAYLESWISWAKHGCDRIFSKIYEEYRYR